MPNFVSLSPQQAEELFTKTERSASASQRRIVRQQYANYLRDMQPGQAMIAEIGDDETKVLVRKRLQSAAKDLGYQLEFKRNRKPKELPFRRVG